MRTYLHWVVAVALVAAGCAGTQTAGAQTRTVQIDGSPEEFAAFALAFFPSRVTVHAGDTVHFEQVFTGEPHSVTLGTLVDDAIPAFKALGPEDAPSEELLEKGEKLPDMLPEGPGDADQRAVNPCFVASGSLPSEGTERCPEVEQPDFDGTQVYYSSGFVAPGATFDVPLADDIQPGTYAFYCNLHGPLMSGEIVVVEDDIEIPSQADVEAARDVEIEAAFASSVQAWEAAQQGTPFGTVAGYGALEDEEGSTGIAEFIPGTIQAKVGEKVSWAIIGPHTITFNAPSDVGHPLVQADDGTWHVSEKAAAPAGGPGQPAPAEEEGEPPAEGEGPPEPTEVDGGSFDGQAFRSSGLFLSFPAPGGFFSYSLTFTQAGSFRYVCLVHPAMTGVVEVT